MLTWIPYARKALVAAGGALAQLGYAVTEASDGGTSVTVAEWIAVAVAAVTAVGVYGVANRAPADGPDV